MLPQGTTTSMYRLPRNVVLWSPILLERSQRPADLTWGLLLSIARRIPEGDRYIRAGKWNEWKFMFMLGGDVYDHTLGIIGMGRIGQAVARRAQGFGMRVLYHNRQRLDATLEQTLARPGSRSKPCCSGTGVCPAQLQRPRIALARLSCK